jgi:maleylacetoacetate isomerase/maleylpyruvate isomerase
VLTLYTYFRSSAAFRVRIALNLKGLSYEPRFVHLKRGEQRAGGYLALNPQGLVPTLVHDGQVLGQSLAIIEYLEERYPEPPLLPKPAAERARVRALALAVACEIHPLDNLRVLQYLEKVLGRSEAERLAWYRHWIHEGFRALEAMLAPAAAYCHGETPTLADCCLVPQVWNARRFECDLAPYPNIRRIYETCVRHPAFVAAAPENQPDREP